MLTELLTLLRREPHLVTDHLQAYANEVGAAHHAWKRSFAVRAALGAIGILLILPALSSLLTLLSLAISGNATFSGTLIALPLVFMLVGAIVLVFALRATPSAFVVLKDNLSRDWAMVQSLTRREAR